ncbi:MAG: histidine phosphatase family protein [Paludibacterium sp.]|uniref:histidine phosphatase family protein n=1 Tax=Paludibacterium sp. TaxID=1917523 RepID=UPI0025FABFF2|nr:histidine phosphatase family protein [Paludibacterium sp.]MBV8047002.1 histidine phosphatase family protein [Paludibacterium sp.]MBV8649074.1 histidine phosphatase family protein [Paludibacterium sp.]
MRLWLIRHPRPEVEPGICYGRSDLGVGDDTLAAAVGALAPRLPSGVPLFSSPLKRCACLAEALAPGAVRYDARLMEMDFGAWEMRHWQDIARAEVDAWAQDLPHYRPGGGESLTQMAERVAAFCHALRHDGVEQAAVVCHAGTIRLLDTISRGLPPQAAAAETHNIPYGALLTLDTPEEGIR